MSELVVIGGGPAGVTAALRARELGAEVLLIEREKLGGTCTNDGCVPTRALAKAARLVRDAEQFADYGLRGLAPGVDFSGVLLSARQVVEKVHDKKRLRDRLGAAEVEVLTGRATSVSRTPTPFGSKTAVPGERRLRSGATASSSVLGVMPGGSASRAPSTPSPTATCGTWSRCRNRSRS